MDVEQIGFIIIKAEYGNNRLILRRSPLSMRNVRDGCRRGLGDSEGGIPTEWERLVVRMGGILIACQLVT